MGRTSDETRQLLVAAGLASLRELTAAQLVTAVGTRAIAARAGVSGPTLFHQFGSVEAYAAALVARVYDPITSPTADINAKVDVLARTSSPLRTALDLHRSEFSRVVADPEHRLRVGLWAFGGDAATEAYGHYVRGSDAQVVVAAGRLYAAWGREVRPPFDLAMFVAAQAALLSGSVIRHRVDPAAVDHERFAQTAAALSAVMLRTAEDPADLDHRLAEINGYGQRARWSPGSAAARGTREQVLTSAVATFDRVGHAEATMADVARDAHVSESTLYAMFRGRVGLAVEVLLRLADGIPDPRPEVPTDDDLLASLLDNATNFAAKPAQVSTGDLPPFATSPVTTVAVYSHALAIAGGRLYAWGSASGRLGIGSTMTSAPVPVRVHTVQNGTGSALPDSVVVSLVAAGSQASYVVAGGRVYACGLGRVLGIGDGSTTQFPVMQALPYFDDKTVVALSAGTAHGLAIDGAGAVHAWGAQVGGRLGDQVNGDAAAFRTTPTAATAFDRFVGGVRVRAVAALAGGTTSHVLYEDGVVLATGGQSSSGPFLGDGSPANTVTGSGPAVVVSSANINP